ncbi:MAG: histidinol dehydrogenase [Longimicrobiales bacterium]
MTEPASIQRPVRLRRMAPKDVDKDRAPAVPRDVLLSVSEIIDDLSGGGVDRLRSYAERLDDLRPEDPLTRTPEEMADALARLPPDHRTVLERTADRIRAFAEAQRNSILPTETPVPGGRAGDRIVPVDVAGCYAPGGRYPLPSSVLMTAVTARVAGVKEVWVASPRPSQAVLAAGAVAGADGLLAVGGAQAVTAMAFGIGEVPRCDVVVGPGNHWVTAAKLLLSGVVGIDLLAGPSELVVLADADGDPRLIAADLLAQAEHDTEALPILVTPSAPLIDAVEAELASQLADLPTAAVARPALDKGCAVLTSTAEEALDCCQRLAPEHLQLHGEASDVWSEALDRFGGLFIGESSAEVFGDYGVGPNHTLPTGGTARYASGLSVASFLRRPTWMRLGSDLPEVLVRDAATLARIEGLEAHARAAELRLGS